MEDPNLPQDMARPSQRRKGALPSLQGEGGNNPGGSGAANEGRPRRRKPPAMDATVPPLPPPPPLAAHAEEQQDPVATVAAQKARKKRRPRGPAGAGEAESSPDHGTAPISAQQQLLPLATDTVDAGDSGAAAVPAGRPRRKKRQPAAVPDAAAVEEARRSPEGRAEDDASAAATAAAVSTVSRTRHIDVEGMPLAKALETVRDDVVTQGSAGRVNFGADLTDGGVEDPDVGGVGGGRQVGDSNMSDTIFWQTQDTRKFKAEKMDKYQQRQDQDRREREQYLEGVTEEDTSNRTLKCAIGFTKVYNYIGTVLLGLMPGFAILHAAYVWTLGSGYQTFLASYSTLAIPMPILYYVVLTLIVLSVLDRYDTGKLDRQSCLDCASFRHAGMVILLYMPGYVVSNAMYPTDQWIRRYSYNTTAYAGMSGGDALVQSWRIMDAVRAACLTLGWLVVAFNPQFNRLAANLETELDDLIGDEQRLEMGTTATAAPKGTTTGMSVTVA